MEEFIIPSCKDDLLKTNCEQYNVKNIYPISDLDSKLLELKTYLTEEGEFFILQNFDPLFSILVHFKKLPDKIKDRTWNLLMLAFQKLPFSVRQIFDNSEHCDDEIRMKMLNSVKMLSYLVIEFMIYKSEKPSKILTMEKSKKRNVDNENNSWYDLRNELLIIIYNLISNKDLIRLWQPPVPDDEFVNLISKCCYVLLEDEVICLNKFINQREKSFQILGILIKNYNHGFTATIKLVEIIKVKENLATIIAQGIGLIVNEYGCISLVRQLLREITQVTQNDIAQDKGNFKILSTFLSELATLLPDIVLEAVNVLIPLLEEESHYMRMAVLDILKIMLQNILIGTLDEDKKIQRLEFFSHIETHLYDLNSWVRTKVLKIWLDLWNEKRLLVEHHIHIFEKVVGRLEDKSSNVRKASMQFITAFLKDAPFKFKENIDKIKEELKSEKEALNALTEEESFFNEPKAIRYLEIEEEVEKAVERIISEENTILKEDENFDISPENFSEIMNQIKNYMEDKQFDEACILYKKAENAMPQKNTDKSLSKENKITSMLESLQKIFLEEDVKFFSSKRLNEIKEEMEKRKKMIKYLDDNVSFHDLINRAVDMICEMLDSSTQTDVIESIDFIVNAIVFEVPAIDQAMIQILSQIWSKDQAIRDSVTRAYKKVYLECEFSNSRQYASYVVGNLSKLLLKVNYNQFIALKLLIQNWLTQDIIHKSCIQIIWETFALSLPDVTEEESLASLILLEIVASIKPKVIELNIQTLITIGFGPRGENSFHLISLVCGVLLQLPQKDQDGKWKKFPNNHEVFGFNKILIKGILKKEDIHYIEMANKAIKVIFQFAEEPIIMAEDLLKNIHSQFLIDSEKITDSDLDIIKTDSVLLSRFLFIIGEVALCLAVFLENDVLQELKNRKQPAKKGYKIHSPNVSSPISCSPRIERINQELRKKKISQNKKSLTDNSNKNSDDESVAASNLDEETDYILDICQNDLFASDRILSFYLNLIYDICTDSKLNANCDLILHASYALGKFMSISINICKKYLNLLITIFRQTKHSKVRSNLITTFGDLAYKYPNELEQHTHVLYEGLKDTNLNVQINTLLILKDLIFNEMIKIKGQITDIAICIIHSNKKISEMAKSVFSELAMKGNALYNTLPDIISRLSNRDENLLKEEDFQIIMRFIMNLINKERHIESLVEKLCVRVHSSTSDQQMNDLLFCLSLLNLTDRAIFKLNENFHFFSEKMHNDAFYIGLQNILQQISKNAKSTTKPLIDEMEEKLENYRSKGIEEKEIKARVVINNSNDSPKSETSLDCNFSFSEKSENSSEAEKEENESLSSTDSKFLESKNDKSLNKSLHDDKPEDHVDRSPLLKRNKINNKRAIKTPLNQNNKISSDEEDEDNSPIKNKSILSQRKKKSKQ